MENKIFRVTPHGTELYTREETEDERTARELAVRPAPIPSLGERISELETVQALLMEGL